MVIHENTEMMEVSHAVDGQIATTGTDVNKPIKPIYRKLRTGATYVAFFGDGIPLGLLGTSLVDLSIYMGVGIKEMATIFIWRFAGNVVGNAATGYGFHIYDHHLLLWLIQLASAAILIVSPWWPNLLLFSFFMFLLGITHGGLGTGVNSCIVHLWRERSSPFTHCLFISVMIGGAVISQLVKPFLSDPSTATTNCTRDLNTSTTSTNQPPSNSSTDGGDFSHDEAVLCSAIYRVHWAFITCGCLAFLLSMGNLTAFTLTGCKLRQVHIYQEAETVSQDAQENSPEKISRLLLWILFFSLTFMFGGLEQSYGGLISAFVVKTLGWTTSKAANMTSLVYGCLAFGRVIGASLSPFIKPKKIMAFVVLALLVSNAIITFAAHEHEIVVWVFTASISSSLSPCIPLSLTWGRCVLGMTAKCPAVLLAGYNAGRMSTPVLVGYLFDQLDAVWFLYAGLFHSVAIVVIFLILFKQTYGTFR